VEEGWAEKNISRQVAHEYLDELVREDVGTLILGCTHYPLLKNMLYQEFPGMELIDGSIETAKRVKNFLKQGNGLSSQAQGSVHIYISDLTDYFQTLEKLFFGGEIASIQDVRLSEDCEEQLDIRG
jgi:glutamate racemase